jgi:hypothetical protein
VAEQKCDMRCGEPYDFAWCLTHDTTFDLGEVCPEAVSDDHS